MHSTRATTQTKGLEIEFELLYFVLLFLGGQRTLRLIWRRPSMGDYYSAIARAVPNLPNKTDEARRAIYERACTALQESSRTLEISEVEQAKAQFALFQSGAYRLGSNPAPFYGPLFQSPRPVPL